MNSVLNHDSTKTFKPIIYQFLIALEKCFKMRKNELVWIEKYGDVTSSNGEQIEVKDYKKDLTDLDHNIWKTLKNWLDDKFDISHYHSFVLLTTQTISLSSKFINWNTKNKDEKLQILESIKEGFDKKKGKSETTQTLLNYVLDKSKIEKLLEILDKFFIQSKAEKDEALYKRLIETRTNGILEDKKEDYIDSLLGFITKPKITSNEWEITYNEFRQKTRSLIETSTSTTKIFPKIGEVEIDDDIEKEHQEYLFVKKIEEIEYHEVKSEAIHDFIYTRRTIKEELESREISKEEYDSYENEILRSLQVKRRKALRSIDSTNYLENTKNLYDDVTGEIAPNFYNFNDTPKAYRNGVLHEMANDEENPTKLVWKLEAKDE